MQDLYKYRFIQSVQQQFFNLVPPTIELVIVNPVRVNRIQKIRIFSSG